MVALRNVNSMRPGRRRMGNTPDRRVSDSGLSTGSTRLPGWMQEAGLSRLALLVTLACGLWLAGSTCRPHPQNLGGAGSGPALCCCPISQPAAPIFFLHLPLTSDQLPSPCVSRRWFAPRPFDRGTSLCAHPSVYFPDIFWPFADRLYGRIGLSRQLQQLGTRRIIVAASLALVWLAQASLRSQNPTRRTQDGGAFSTTSPRLPEPRSRPSINPHRRVTPGRQHGRGVVYPPLPGQPAPEW